MSEHPQGKDKEAWKIATTSIVLLAALGLATVLLLPLASAFIDQYLSPGMSLKDAAIAAFFTTVVTLVIFAVAAGDGLLGELQFMLGGFFGFFLVLWLMIAWIF
jgi:hypothetical protein